MERKFILSCGSTVDLPYSYCESRGIPVIFYTYVVDGREYIDDMGRDPAALPGFYGMLSAGKLPHTSQVNTEAYIEFFDSLLRQGDVLHIAFGSGLSGSALNARAAMEAVAPRYPDRTIRVVDSLAASSGHGMLVDYIADLRDNGASLEDAYRWAEKKQAEHQPSVLQHRPHPPAPKRPGERRRRHARHHARHLPHHAPERRRPDHRVR